MCYRTKGAAAPAVYSSGSTNPYLTHPTSGPVVVITGQGEGWTAAPSTDPRVVVRRSAVWITSRIKGKGVQTAGEDVDALE